MQYMHIVIPQHRPEPKSVILQPVQKEQRPSIDTSLFATQHTFWNCIASGLSIEEIAQRECVAPSTVMGHLCQWIEEGEDIDISGLVER